MATSVFCSRAEARTDADTIRLSSDPRLGELADRFNKSHEISGYRIQITSANRKEAAKKVLSRFASLYGNIKAYEIYQQPFFVVKVGDFLTKLEARKFHREIEEAFPGSFIVPDQVDPMDQYMGSEEIR